MSTENHTTQVVSREERIGTTKAWKKILATVCGDYDISERVAPQFSFTSQMSSHVCLKGSSNIVHLITEHTICSVEDGQITFALMVNTTGRPMKIKHGLNVGDCLLYDRKVVTNPLNFSTSWTAQIRKSTCDTDIIGQGPLITLSSAVKVVDYPDLKSLLTDLLGQFRRVWLSAGNF